MSEAFTRASALAKVAVPGRFGASHGAPGLVLSVVHHASPVMVIARAGKGKAVGDVLSKQRGIRIMWAGLDQWYVVGSTFTTLAKSLAGVASVVDQSHGRLTLRIAGLKVRAVLAKGTPLDLHTDHFPVGKSAVTQMAHVGVHLTCTAEDAFELSVFRGFAESFWEWLTEMSLEFGYQVM